MGKPTCSHCYDRHNIMSCEKLAADYKTAKPKVAAWTDADTKKYEQGQFARWYFRPIDRQDKSKGYRHEQAEENGEIDEYYQSRLDNAGLPTLISQERYDDMDEAYMSGGINHSEQIVRLYEEIMTSKARRAAKSCSYCKGEGHTVRTCQQRKDDVVTYENVILLDSYYKAKALSAYGLWTASMIACETESRSGCYMLTSEHRYRPGIHNVMFLSDFEGEEGTPPAWDIETQFLAAVTEEINFVNVRDLNNNAYYKDTMNGYELNFFAEEKLFVLRHQTKDDPGCKFLPTKVTFEHIFSTLAQRVSELPKGAFDKDTRLQSLNLRSPASGYSGEEISMSAHNHDLLEGRGVNRKERYTYVWKRMERWVESQKEIVNKIRRELV